MQPSLDDLRRMRPDLAMALYALEPGQGVTLEIIHDGQVYPFKAPTEAEAILQAFPPKPAEPPPPPKPDTSIFD